MKWKIKKIKVKDLKEFDKKPTTEKRTVSQEWIDKFTWKWIPQGNNKYKTNGIDVLSIARTKKCKGGGLINSKNLILKECVDSDGYHHYTIDGKTIKKHRIVWQYYFGDYDKSLQINHKDGNKQNNKISNLELCTIKENIWHKNNILGKNQIGEKNGFSKLKNDDVKKIKKMINENVSSGKIASAFSVHKSCIKHIKAGRTWSWLTI